MFLIGTSSELPGQITLKYSGLDCCLLARIWADLYLTTPFGVDIPVSHGRDAPHAPKRFAPPNEDLTSVIYRI